MNVIGEILEFKGKVVPEFMKIRKYFSRKRHEKKETAQTLKEVKQLTTVISDFLRLSIIKKVKEDVGYVCLKICNKAHF